MVDGQEVVYDWYNLARGNFTEDTLPLNSGETSSFLPHLLNLMSVSFFGFGGKCTAAMSTTLHVHVQMLRCHSKRLQLYLSMEVQFEFLLMLLIDNNRQE